MSQGETNYIAFPHSTDNDFLLDFLYVDMSLIGYKDLKQSPFLYILKGHLVNSLGINLFITLQWNSRQVIPGNLSVYTTSSLFDSMSYRRILKGSLVRYWFLSFRGIPSQGFTTLHKNFLRTSMGNLFAIRFVFIQRISPYNIDMF